MNKYNIHIIALLIFYENMKICSSRCWVMSFMASLKKLSILFVYTTRQTIFKWYVISGCHIWWFSWDWDPWGIDKHHVLLWFCKRRKQNCLFVVSYQVSIILPFKMVLIKYPKSYSLDHVPLKIKQKIHTIDKYGTESSIPCNRSIPSAINNLNNIHLKS